MDEGGYASEGLASIVEELQKVERKFDTKFEEVKKERGEANNLFKEVVELEERLKRIETLIEEKGEGIHMEVDSNERAKGREICKEAEITELKRRIEEGERRDKRKNIIVSGLKLVDEAWKIKGRDGKEIIAAECENETMKKVIMLNKNKLKGRDMYIDRDMTWQQREVRRKKKERARAENEQGKKAVVKGDILIMNSKVYKWTRGNTVIDYVITNKAGREKMVNMKVGKSLKSDHLPLELSLETRSAMQERVKKQIHMWDEEAVKKYQRNIKNWETEKE
ncbi:hypothetical protein QAD02_021454 [Eretmocerus hayati]|uniref:Uncharacterized protein n=1 Tax=Eretmocerus hayati TaxID=131215 RepID=A0ACC2PS64_9HYME|nr:hypothetical protein QAD02_021454 [Eretmocerus hayati]